MDSFIATTPFFTADQRRLADRVEEFASREIEPRASADERDVE